MEKQKIWKAEDVIDLVPDTLLDTIASETGVDYSVKKLHGKHIFKLFLFAFLNGKSISLRILEAIFMSEKFKNLFNVQAKPVKHSAIGMRLATIDYHYFEKIFEHLIRSPQLENVLFDRRKISVSKIDSTIVTLSAKLLKVGLDDNPGFKTLKFGVQLSGGIPVQVMLFKGQKYLSEDNALPMLILEKKRRKSLQIAIFDRGIQRKQNFADFHAQGVFFISRVSTQKMRVIEDAMLTETETPTLRITADQIVRFANDEGMKKESANTSFRMITGTTKDTNHAMKFLTNVLFLSAAEITELYKSRWEIETFFKFIKQEMNFSHLLSRSENGITVVMFLTMIAAILLTLYKKLNNIIGWAVAKIKFLDQLESGVLHDWHAEIRPAFSLFPVATIFNSS